MKWPSEMFLCWTSLIAKKSIILFQVKDVKDLSA